MYVGITRAQRSLTVTYCERRKAGPDLRVCEPSRFIAEMGEGVAVARKDDAPVSREVGSERLASLRAMLASRDD